MCKISYYQMNFSCGRELFLKKATFARVWAVVPKPERLKRAKLRFVHKK
jgi:hypothetical protein